MTARENGHAARVRQQLLLLENRMASLRDRRQYIDQVIGEYRAPVWQGMVSNVRALNVSSYLMQLEGMQQKLQAEEARLSSQSKVLKDRHAAHVLAKSRYEKLEARAWHRLADQQARNEHLDQDELNTRLFNQLRESR